jgi:hypothetical protein
MSRASKKNNWRCKCGDPSCKQTAHLQYWTDGNYELYVKVKESDLAIQSYDVASKDLVSFGIILDLEGLRRLQKSVHRAIEVAEGHEKENSRPAK